MVGGFRYFGVHLSINLTKRYTTLEDRVARALAPLRKLRFVQATLLGKAKAIRVKIYAGLFYGTEASDLKESHLARISAAVIDVFK